MKFAEKGGFTRGLTSHVSPLCHLLSPILYKALGYLLTYFVTYLLFHETNSHHTWKSFHLLIIRFFNEDLIHHCKILQKFYRVSFHNTYVEL